MKRERGARTGAPLACLPSPARPARRRCVAQYTPYSSTASRSAITFSGLASPVMELAPSTMSPPVSPKSSISSLT